MRLRPCIDIHDGKVKQIVGGSLRDDTGAQDNYVSQQDAAYYASLYRERNLPGGHIILLNSIKDPEMYAADKAQATQALQAYPGGMQIGGGITPETAGEFLDAGASHVIVTSYVFREGMLDRLRLDEMIRAVGRDHLVLDLSCRKNRETGEYRVVTDRWQRETLLPITDDVLDSLAESCDEFLIHAADVEGKRGGVETELLAILGAWQQDYAQRHPEIGAVPITYAGGVHALTDVDLIAEAGHGHIDYTVGSALDLFGGTLSLDALSNYRVESCG